MAPRFILLWLRLQAGRLSPQSLTADAVPPNVAWCSLHCRADIRIRGCMRDQQALRFSLFHLRQSHPEDPRRSIGAIGMTGDKYCGHVFWDTEMYMAPHFLYMAQLGDFVPLKGGRFCINAVCGPDEYGCGVNNNCYLNMMAQWHFRYAAATYREMRRRAPAKLRALCAATGLCARDVARWTEAADKMFIPYNSALGIHEENDTFLGLAPVDMTRIPKNTDIREQMHPLNLWRLQVVKQADVVLLMFVLGHQFSRAVKARNYAFYEPRTNHGSSLSACIHAIIACEIGRMDDAYRYFRQSAMMDLQDHKNNTVGGIHAACLGGTWMAVINGFAGMRDYPDGLHFAPHLPAAWDAYAFNVVWRGRRIAVEVTRAGARVRLLTGKPCAVHLNGRRRQLLMHSCVRLLFN